MTAQPAITPFDDDEPAAARALGSSFYLAMRIMPPGQREAMFEIYSFCRAVDDIADDLGPREPRLAALDKWRADIDAVYAGQTPRGLKGLAVAVRDFDLAREDFHAVIDGMQMDITGDIRAPDFATFDLYCDRVASAVGRLSVRVFGLEREDGLKLAHHLGRALQFTNVLRDVDEDAQLGRLYLPREFLADAGIISDNPETVLASPRIGEACSRIAELAREHFVQADAVMAKYPRKTVRTPRVMSEAYKTILDAVIARGWAPPRNPIRLSKPRLAWVVLRHAVF